jgi:hypothetical protein
MATGVEIKANHSITYEFYLILKLKVTACQASSQSAFGERMIRFDHVIRNGFMQLAMLNPEGCNDFITSLFIDGNESDPKLVNDALIKSPITLTGE